MFEYVKKIGFGVVLELRHDGAPPAIAPEGRITPDKMKIIFFVLIFFQKFRERRREGSVVERGRKCLK